ncbi:MAG TPA: SUMF1/EgtB/PvdO family nonheme iron enzyme [Accumulibacter sp.]|uniref:SUMF1/EgtB/PvdO family nonheme iron enzyme n=1 Tax=Accumulibacter sp. TaxID=2053492 RepID=UPI002BC470BD|nr:SUMF1/EgtB/PvdO family nonheme iron enzyme [Accumulibacter sp.]HMW56563.1 SUMF1/EgtB/PvdO family nonheme iron enzyme [Accumulibacter sp.]
MAFWVFGWCCVLPLFRDSVLCSLRSLSLRDLGLRRGCGGNFPRRAQRGARFFCYPSPAGWQHPVRQSGEVVRGGSWNNHRDNARCAYRNRNHPGNRNDNLGFRVVLRSSHVLPPLLLVPPSGGTARRHPPCRSCSGNAGRFARADLPAEAKEEEQRQTGLVRAQAARQGDSGAIARAGRIAKHGNGQADAPAVPAPAPATGMPWVRRTPRPRDPSHRACRMPFAESSRRAAARPGRRGG